jgi:alpha-beta hydrolase superfamily lysophospholipase
MPDVIVPISGCHYEFEGQKVGYFEFETGLSELSNHDADIVLVGGTDDPDCESWQSHDATEDFQAAGYNAKLVEIDGADHHTVIYKEFVDGEVATLPDEPAGDEVVQTILDAIDAAGP